MNQCDKILRHIDTFGSITSAEAYNEYGILRLASRISDLRKSGVALASKPESGKNRFGDTIHYVRYFRI